VMMETPFTCFSLHFSIVSSIYAFGIFMTARSICSLISLIPLN